MSINPTRFVAHQPGRAFRGLAVHEWGELPEPTLASRRVTLSTSVETSLDGKDNILVPGASQSFGRPDAWPLHLQRYWDGLLDQLADEFTAAAAVANGCLELRSFLNLRAAQTYWEFSHPDPTALVRELEPALFELGASAEARSFPYELGETTTRVEENSRSLTIRLRSGVRLRVYAKTTGRVRFEIDHDLVENPRPLGGRHTAQTTDALVPWLGILAADAAEQLSGVFQHLANRTFFPPHSLPRYNLIRRVISACADEREADAVLSLLINNSAIRLRAHDPLRSVVADLVRYEVLELQGRVYVMTPQFRRAMADLRGERRLQARTTGLQRIASDRG